MRRFCPVALLLATQDCKSNPRLPWNGHTAQPPCPQMLRATRAALGLEVPDRLLALADEVLE